MTTRTAFAFALLLGSSLFASRLDAQEGALRTGQASPAPASGALPPGHPAVPSSGDTESAEALPPGHPHTQHAAARNPEAPPESSSEEDTSVPSGTIVVDVKNANGSPVPNAVVTMGIVFNSVAKGESRKHLTLTTDTTGVARFTNLEVASQIAYRPTLSIDGATFSAPPFQLKAATGVRSTLYVFPVTRRVEEATIVTQSILFVEVKDDRVQVQQAFSIFNFGKSAWLPNDVVITLPREFTAFSAQQGMTDVGVDLVEGKGVRLRGTIYPGRHDVEFRWQLPYSGDSDVSLDVGLTPNVAVARVMSPASQEMHLEATGFPPAESRTDNQGQRILVTERQLMRNDTPLKSLHARITGIPTRGNAPFIATGLSALVMAFGLFLSTRRSPSKERAVAGAQEDLVHELSELEQAFQKGEIGKKTYERERRMLLNDLARTFPKDAVSTT